MSARKVQPPARPRGNPRDRKSLFGAILRMALTALALLSATGLVHAEAETTAQRLACEPDVFRLCKDLIPNRTAITNCLVRNKPRLSTDCRAVFNGQLK